MFAPHVLREYLFGRLPPSRGCLRSRSSKSALPRRSLIGTLKVRGLTTKAAATTPSSTTAAPAPAPTPAIPFRKQLKDQAKAAKANLNQSKKNVSPEHHPDWDLTVGIEIHAQLNTPRKLFSSSASTINADPNTHVSLFDLAVPGSQPVFQQEVLIPAIRAALALNCTVQTTSKFDRKHYFHWDQPSGYQITQYYEPYAKKGWLDLGENDGIAPEDGERVRVGIKQVQMEQDTAKTIAQPEGGQFLDFNRVGLPLIEIITTPCIKSPSTAAAYVRKVQNLLMSVDACTIGMEDGGLRADVNVSVTRRGEKSNAGAEYAGFKGLGQRTEIKNLSSTKSIRDAIVAERDRQILVLEAGGQILGETRGWTIGSTETKRLRGKEGEVDYRYMPDPDIPPLLIGKDLIWSLADTSGVSLSEELKRLVKYFGLTRKDAMSLLALDNGCRVEYFYKVATALKAILPDMQHEERGRVCGNWILHELGGLVSEDPSVLQTDMDGNCVVPADQMASIINHLQNDKITGKTAKQLLARVLSDSLQGNGQDVTSMIEEENLWFEPMSPSDYQTLAEAVLNDNQRAVDDILIKGQAGKVMFLVGQMMRRGEEGRVEPKVAETVVRELLEKRRS